MALTRGPDAKQPSAVVMAVLGAAAGVLLLASVASLVFVDYGDDSPSGTAAPAAPPPEGSEAPTTETTQAAPAPQPVGEACNLVSVQSVASAIGARPADVRAEQSQLSLGLKCDYMAPQEEDVLIAFTIQVIDAGGDANFARSTIEARAGKRVGGLGDAAVLEQSDVSSRISVAKGARYVQLQTHRKPTTEDAMIGLARQAVGKL